MPNNFKIAVIGDSVGWGQGLLDAHKYAIMIASKYGVTPDMFAHSGAKIGMGLSNTPSAPSSEIPYPVPTVVSQLSQVADPSTYDLVFINGGINDITFQHILNPLTTSFDLANNITQRCYTDMKALLQQAIGVFNKPTCRFILTGYYPILSGDSGVQNAAEPLDRLLGVHGLSIPLFLDRGPIVDHIIANTLQFWKQSDAAFTNAAQEITMQFNLGGRLQFVQCPLTEQNALFASDPWLWGFNPDLSPEDEVANSRIASCNAFYTNPLDLVTREQCFHASVGHPNIKGAAQIAAAISNVLPA